MPRPFDSLPLLQASRQNTLLPIRICLALMACFQALHASAPPAQLSEPLVRADLHQQYRALKQGQKHRFRLLDEEKATDYTEIIQKGKVDIAEGYFSSRERLEAMALVQHGENTGPEWGQPTTALLAHYACVDDHWELLQIETWYAEIIPQDVDADGIDELWVRQPRDGMMAGAESVSLMSYAGGQWATLWEHEGTDVLAHTDYAQSPPKQGDVLLDKESIDIRWAAGQSRPSIYVRREIRTCNQPQCRSSEELELEVSWTRVKREGDALVPVH